MIIDKSPHNRPQTRPNKRRRGKQRHRSLQRSPRKQITHSAARHGEEGAPREAVEEAEHDDGGDVAGDGLRDQEYEVERPSDEVDGAAAVELAKGTEDHRPKGDAQDEGREAEDGDDAGVVEVGFHVGVGGGVDGACACSVREWVSRILCKSFRLVIPLLRFLSLMNKLHHSARAPCSHRGNISYRILLFSQPSPLHRLLSCANYSSFGKTKGHSHA